MKKISLLVTFAAILCACDKVPQGGSDIPERTEPSKIIITEIDGAKDMIELYNSGSVTESLDGFKIRRYRTKDGVRDEQTMWTGHSGVTLKPGEYLALYYEEGKDDNKKYPRNLQHPFSSKKNLSLWLQDENENKLCSFVRGSESVGWGLVAMQKTEDPATGEAYSYSNIGGKWSYAVPTPGKANGKSVGNIDLTLCTVAINEIDMDNSKVELYNYGLTPVDLKGFQLRWSRIKDEADNQTLWEPSVSTVLAPGAFLAVPVKVNLAEFKGKNIHLKLRNPNAFDCAGNKICWDDFKRGVKDAGWTMVTLPAVTGSLRRVPDGYGLWYLGSASIGSSNGTDISKGLVPDVDQD